MKAALTLARAFAYAHGEVERARVIFYHLFVYLSINGESPRVVGTEKTDGTYKESDSKSGQIAAEIYFHLLNSQQQEQGLQKIAAAATAAEQAESGRDIW